MCGLINSTVAGCVSALETWAIAYFLCCGWNGLHRFWPGWDRFMIWCSVKSKLSFYLIFLLLSCSYFKCLIRCSVDLLNFTLKLCRCYRSAATNNPFTFLIIPEERPPAVTYLIKAASLPWLPSLRPLAGFCQSSLTSPRLPYPRRSPCSPWLQTQRGGTNHLHTKKEASMLLVEPRWSRVFKKSMSLLCCSSKMKQMHPNHSQQAVTAGPCRKRSVLQPFTVSSCRSGGGWASVCCSPFSSVLSVAPPWSSNISLTFGKWSASRIDVTRTTCRDSPIKTGELSTVACVGTN